MVVSKLKLVFKAYINFVRNAVGRNKWAYMAFFILFTANASYIAYFALISLMRMWSLNANVYDLGVVMEQSWLVFHTNWTLHLFLSDFGYFSGRFLLSPLFVPGSFTLILIAQTVAIAIPSFFVYGIAMKIVKRRLPSLLISLSYLIYFPLAGMNLFDFHYMVFFPLFSGRKLNSLKRTNDMPSNIKKPAENTMKGNLIRPATRKRINDAVYLLSK